MPGGENGKKRGGPFRFRFHEQKNRLTGLRLEVLKDGASALHVGMKIGISQLVFGIVDMQQRDGIAIPESGLFYDFRDSFKFIDLHVDNIPWLGTIRPT